LFKVYTTFDIISEINTQILRCEHSIQLLVDENDLFFITDSLFTVFNKNIEIEIVIVSIAHKKSLRIVNLCKRLVDGGVSVYWFYNSVISNDELFFAIFDKTFLIDKPNPEVILERAEELVRAKNVFFKSTLLDSEKLKLLSGEINADFGADKTIIKKNESVQLQWNIENAYHVSIEPMIGDVPLIGSIVLNLNKDQRFLLTAINKESSISKILFIKVFENKDIEFIVSALDPIINQYIKIESSSLNEGNYGVYSGQTIKISWEINMIGKLYENTIGNLPLVGSHELKIMKETQLFFTFMTLQNRQIKKLIFHTFDRAQINNKLNIQSPTNNSQYSPGINRSFNKSSKIKNFLVEIYKKIQSK
jgi:hypothetical protein